MTSENPFLQQIFALEKNEENQFTAPATGGPLLRLYGGQVFAQALTAAHATIAPDKLAHSAHAYFLRPGDPEKAIHFTVSRDSDGRSFSARRVTAAQDGKTILTLAMSAQRPEPGLTHQIPMPQVTPAQDLLSQDDILHALERPLPERNWPFWLHQQPIEYRPVEPFDTYEVRSLANIRHFWFRSRYPLNDDPRLHQHVLSYASDLHIIHTGLRPLGISWVDPRLQDVSLDHAIWFHDDFRADEWLLYALDSPVAGHARTTGRGLVYAADGRLVASVVQEGLIRLLSLA